MTTHDMSDTDLRETAKMLDAFASVLDREDVARLVARQLADELDNVGGAHYGDVGERPMGPFYVAQRARELASRISAQR